MAARGSGPQWRRCSDIHEGAADEVAAILDHPDRHLVTRCGQRHEDHPTIRQPPHPIALKDEPLDRNRHLLSGPEAVSVRGLSRLRVWHVALPRVHDAPTAGTHAALDAAAADRRARRQSPGTSAISGMRGSYQGSHAGAIED
jgi:hypothetical protein